MKKNVGRLFRRVRSALGDSEPTGRHEAYYKSKDAQSVFHPSAQREIPFLADEMIKVEVSYKVSEQECIQITSNSHGTCRAFSTLSLTPTSFLRNLNSVLSSGGPTAPRNIPFGYLNVLFSCSPCYLHPAHQSFLKILSRSPLSLPRLLAYHLFRTGRTCGLHGTSLPGGWFHPPCCSRNRLTSAISACFIWVISLLSSISTCRNSSRNLTLSRRNSSTFSR